MNENDRLEVVLAANFQKALTAIQSTNTELKNTVMLVKNVKASFDGTGNLKGFAISAQSVKQASSNTKELNANLSNTQKIINTGFNLGKLYLLWNVTKRIRDMFTGILEKSVDFIETTNKFEVAMGDTANKAYSFQKRLSEAFGTLSTDMMNFQATFKNIMSAIPGLSNDAAEQVSETLVKLGLDYSSLYNVDQSTAMSRIQSALVGSVKPIRNDAGYDITEATIGRKSQELGIETSVRNLNQMEKRILRIIVLMDQMRNTGAMQDLARTIEQPANQIKVLKQQVQELGIWLGNVFIGTIGKILPYINGFIMALVEIAKMLAIFVGYTNPGSGIAETLSEDLSTASVGAGGVATGLGKAAASAKEIRKTLMGFDVLNVIQKPSDTSGGGGGGGSAGLSDTAINPALLKALKDYDNLMDKVRMKATDIRDRILEWLGFTGDTQNDMQRLKEIIDKIKIILEAILFAWASKKILGIIGSISAALGASGALGVISKLKDAIASIAISWATAKLAAKEYANFFYNDPKGNALLKAAGYTALSIGAGALAGGKIGSLAGPVGTAVGAVAGATGAAIYTIKESYNENEKQVIKEQQEQIQEMYEMWQKTAKLAKDANNQFFNVDDYNAQTRKYIMALQDLPDKVRKEAERMTEIYRNLALAEVELFDNGGIRIDEYYKKYENAVNKITATSDVWVNLYNEYSESNEKLQQATDSLDIFTTKLGNNAYKVTADDISHLNEILNQMSSYVKASGDAFVDAAVSSTNSLKDEQYISTETADLVVANAIRKAEAEGDAFESYKLKLQDYTIQLQKGLITQEQYNTMVANAKTEFEKAKKGADSTKEAVKYLTEQISGKINFKNWNDAISYTSQLGQLYTDNADKLKTNYDAQLKYYNDQITWTEDLLRTTKDAYGVESEEYKKVANELNALKQARTGATKQYEDDVLQLKKTMYESLRVIEKQLEESGYNIQEDSQGIYKSVQEQLNKIGLDTNIAKNIDNELNEVNKSFEKSKRPLSNKLKEMSNLIKGFTANFDLKPSINIDPNVKLKVSDLKNKLEKLQNALSGLGGNIIGSTLNITLTNAIKKLNSFATGGFPDMGQLFVAREAGPELVGSIGNRNAVVNNDQIVEAVSSGVANAVASVLGNGGSSYQLYIDGEQITDVVQRRLARKANITGMAMGV